MPNAPSWRNQKRGLSAIIQSSNFFNSLYSSFFKALAFWFVIKTAVFVYSKQNLFKIDESTIPYCTYTWLGLNLVSKINRLTVFLFLLPQIPILVHARSTTIIHGFLFGQLIFIAHLKSKSDRKRFLIFYQSFRSFVWNNIIWILYFHQVALMEADLLKPIKLFAGFDRFRVKILCTNLK